MVSTSLISIITHPNPTHMLTLSYRQAKAVKAAKEASSEQANPRELLNQDQQELDSR